MTKSEAFRNLLQSQELNDEMQEMQHELTELIINSDSDQQKVREDARINKSRSSKTRTNYIS